MPGTLAFLITIALVAVVAGGAVGWFLNASRWRRERDRLTSRWREKIGVEELMNERLRRQIRNLTERLETTRQSERDARSRLARTEQEMTDAMRVAEDAAAEVTDCHAALAASNRKRDELHQQLQRLLKRSREVMASAKAKDEKIFLLSRQLASWQERLPPLVDRFREKEREATAAHQALDVERARARELEDTLRTRILPLTGPPGDDLNGDHAPAGAEADVGPRDDDLKRIRGIGPVLERMLNEMGIHRLQQIAEFGPDDVRRVQDALEDFPERIERDRWVEQARDLVSNRPRDLGDTSWLGRTET